MPAPAAGTSAFVHAFSEILLAAQVPKEPGSAVSPFRYTLYAADPG